MPKKTPMSEFDKALCKRIFFSIPGLSDRQIASILDIRRQTVQGWKSGKSRPTLAQLSALTSYTSIDWDWFTTGKTANIKSIVNAYFPNYFNPEIILNRSIYHLSKILAYKLLKTQNSKLFLHPLKVAYTATLGKISDIPEILKNTVFSEKIFSACSDIKPSDCISDYINNIYQKMNNSLIRFSEDDFPEADQSNTSDMPPPLQTPEYIDTFSLCTDTEMTTPSVGSAYSAYAVHNDKHTYTITDNTMNPILSRGQKVITGAPLTGLEISHLVNCLSVVILSNKCLYNNATSGTKVTYKKVSTTSDNSVILTSMSDHIQPQVIPLSQIVSIKPVKAVLY